MESRFGGGTVVHTCSCIVPSLTSLSKGLTIVDTTEGEALHDLVCPEQTFILEHGHCMSMLTLVLCSM